MLDFLCNRKILHWPSKKTLVLQYMSRQNTMRGGSLGTVKEINRLLDLEINHNPPFFRRIHIPVSDEAVRTVNLANSRSVDQFAFELGDSRLKNNFYESTQCFTFIGESHDFSTRNLQLDKYSIKVWTLCKLLQIKYPSSISIYLEIDSHLTHKQVYEEYSEPLADAYKKHEKAMEQINQINSMDFYLEFLHYYDDEQISVMISKKINKPLNMMYNLSSRSQNLKNTSYKLLHGRNDYDKNGMIKGLTFVDSRTSMLESEDYNILYDNNKDELYAFPMNEFENLVENITRVFSPHKSGKIHLETTLESLAVDAKNNNNIFFYNLFTYASITIKLFYESLNAIISLIKSGKYQDVETIVNIKPLKFESNDIFYTLLLNAHSIENSGNISSEQLTRSNIRLTDLFVSNSESTTFGQCSSFDIIQGATTRIMDYDTMISIYDNIFNFNTKAFSPNYHVVVCGSAHTDFLKHCFEMSLYDYNTLNQNYIQRSGKDSVTDIQQFSEILQSEESFTNITNMMYPK